MLRTVHVDLERLERQHAAVLLKRDSLVGLCPVITNTPHGTWTAAHGPLVPGAYAEPLTGAWARVARVDSWVAARSAHDEIIARLHIAQGPVAHHSLLAAADSHGDIRDRDRGKRFH